MGGSGGGGGGGGDFSSIRADDVVECKTHTPSDNMSCGESSLVRVVVACEEVPLLQDERGRRRYFWWITR